VNQLRFTLKLDQDKTSEMPTYYLYRSEEYGGNRPVVDGVYVQRNTIGPRPPDTMSIVLEWDS
jgi:hypothetical protein